jgi:hypothetical protein
MTKEDDQPGGVENVIKHLKASTVTTTFTVEHMLQKVSEDPNNRKKIFEEYFERFRSKPMADPWIWEPAILDNYGVFDDFARSVTGRHNYVGEQNIIAHMENAYMVGSFLTDPEMGSMLLWPGFVEYEWVDNCQDWEDFAKRCVAANEEGKAILKKGEKVSSRLWLAYSMTRADYYNPVVNPRFDLLFPEWRDASLELDAMVLGQGKEPTEERLSKRGYYLDLTLPKIQSEKVRREIQSVLDANPTILRERATFAG